MTEQAIRSAGMYLVRGSQVFAEVIEATPPGINVESVDSTSHNSLGGWKTQIPGWLTAGDAKFKVNFYGSADQLALYTTTIPGRTTDVWFFVIPATLTTVSVAFQFNAFIKDLKAATPMEKDVMTFELTLDITGQPQIITTAAAGLTTPYLSMTNQGATSIALTPTPAGSQINTVYQGTALLADTGVKITPTAAAAGCVIYVNGVVVASGSASAAITIPTTAGTVMYISVMVYENNKIPALYWVRVLHGYV